MRVDFQQGVRLVEALLGDGDRIEEFFRKAPELDQMLHFDDVLTRGLAIGRVFFECCSRKSMGEKKKHESCDSRVAIDEG